MKSIYQIARHFQKVRAIFLLLCSATSVVAFHLDRNSIGIEIQEEYCQLAIDNIHKQKGFSRRKKETEEIIEIRK